MHVKEVLSLLRDNHLYAKLSKCQFSVDTVEFLGFVVSTKGIHMDPQRVTTITEWLTPRTVKEVQSFLGVTNFYRRFITHYSKTAGPLTDLTGNKAPHPFKLPNTAMEAFRKLKDAFRTAPLLVHFQVNKQITLETDTSGFALAGILSQPQEDSHQHPMAFYSHKFTNAELNYVTGDAELLTIVASFKTWRHYMEGAQHQIIVLSDHYNLQTFNTTKVLTRRQAH